MPVKLPLTPRCKPSRYEQRPPRAPAQTYGQMPESEQVQLECLMLKLLASSRAWLADELQRYYDVPPHLHQTMKQLAKLGVGP